MALASAVLGPAGCTAEGDLAEASYTAEREGARARVWIPLHEPRSAGTYRAEVVRDGAAPARVEAERDGMITGVWLPDLEGDGVAELVVSMSSAGSGTYGSLDVYRCEPEALVTLEIEELDETQRLGYMGHDVFSVEQDTLYRSYPVYREVDANAAPSGGTVRLRYSFADSAWVRVRMVTSGETGAGSGQ